jgi:hypothetical protein
MGFVTELILLTGCEKTSSANASVTRLFKLPELEVGVGGAWPNSNFAPRSCSKENSSNDGNLEANSSAAAVLIATSLESRAAKGSLLVPLDPAGVTLADTETGRCWFCVVGRPRRIGTISGIDDVGTGAGATFWMPTIGGEAAFGSGEGNFS